MIILQDEILSVHILLDVTAQHRMYYGYEYVTEEAFVDETMWMCNLEFKNVKTFNFKVEV
jgi:hypothetical protein